MWGKKAGFPIFAIIGSIILLIVLLSIFCSFLASQKCDTELTLCKHDLSKTEVDLIDQKKETVKWQNYYINCTEEKGKCEGEKELLKENQKNTKIIFFAEIVLGISFFVLQFCDKRFSLWWLLWFLLGSVGIAISIFLVFFSSMVF